MVVEEARGIVKNVAIELPQRDNQLQRVPQRMPQNDHGSHNYAAGSPEDRGHRLHAQDESIIGQVSRVRESVLLPHLADERLLGPQCCVVASIVTFEKDVNRSREDKPHGRDQFLSGQVGLHLLGHEVGCREEDEAGPEENGEQGYNAPFVCSISSNVAADGIVWVFCNGVCHLGRV